MSLNKLEEVFKVSGVPTHTFVQPRRYNQMKVAVRTPGRCIVVEGPSGIGKTSSVTRILEELDMLDSVTLLSARKQGDVELISSLPEMGAIGTVIVDDFHRLQDDVKARITDFMKILADEGKNESKIILIGINKAGDRLVQYGSDVGLRIDVFKLEQNPEEFVDELIIKGQDALNIEIANREQIVKSSYGSFQIAQLLCHQMCVDAGVIEAAMGDRVLVDKNVDSILNEVLLNLRRIFHTPCLEFAQGSKLRREGRAPYLHILRWLANSDEWSIDLRRAVRDNPQHRGSVGQVIGKGYLETLLREKAALLDGIFHYQPETSVLTVEDPKLIFYLRTINWKSFVKEVGFPTSFFPGQYDIALSFAGADREYAQILFDYLSKREVSVFYDDEEQHRIIAERVDEYLAPIYRSEAAYVVPFLSPEYPKRIWTKFESDQFKTRFGQKAVIPIRFKSTQDGYFNEPMEYGSLSFDPSKDTGEQIVSIGDTICRRLQEDRLASENEKTSSSDA